MSPPLEWERDAARRAAPGQRDQLVREVAERGRLCAAEVEDLALRGLARAREQQRLHDVVHVVHVAPLLALAVEFDDAALDRLPHEPADEALPVVAQQLARAVGVRQTQADGARAVDAVVEQVVVLGGELVDAVDVHGRDAVLLVEREIERLAVDLPRAGEDDLHVRVEVAAGFEERELGRAVEFEVALRVLHRVEVADVAREVEDVVHAADEVVDDPVVAHVLDAHLQAVFHVADVVGVAP